MKVQRIWVRLDDLCCHISLKYFPVVQENIVIIPSHYTRSRKWYGQLNKKSPDMSFVFS